MRQRPEPGVAGMSDNNNNVCVQAQAAGHGSKTIPAGRPQQRPVLARLHPLGPTVHPRHGGHRKTRHSRRAVGLVAGGNRWGGWEGVLAAAAGQASTTCRHELPFEPENQRQHSDALRDNCCLLA